MEPKAGDLHSLSRLDRQWLHVFVAGPGFGEAVAIALPDEGWLTFDSCEVRFGRASLVSILERWRCSEEEPVEAAVLTHPHQDHCEGLPLFLERFQPDRVLVAGVDTEPKALELQSQFWDLVSRDSEEAEEAIGIAATVRTALKAVRSWEASKAGRAVTWVSDGWRGGFARNRVQLDILAPTGAAMASLFADRARLRRLREVANEYSVVARLTFGKTVLLFGGDLPWKVEGRVLPEGWQRLVDAHPGLNRHSGLKVPHHGSEAALHPEVLRARGASRCWWATPYNRRPRLPSFEPLSGMDILLQSQPFVDLTARPAGRRGQVLLDPPGVVRRVIRGAGAADAEKPSGGPGEVPAVMSWADRPDGGEGRPRSPLLRGATPLRTEGPWPDEALDAVWCCSFDDQGGIRGRWRGRVAMIVVP